MGPSADEIEREIRETATALTKTSRSSRSAPRPVPSTTGESRPSSSAWPWEGWAAFFYTVGSREEG